MPGQEEEPEDEGTPRSRRRPRLVPVPGRGPSFRKRSIFGPRGEEADPESAQRSELPMTGVPEDQPEAIPDMMPEDPQLDQIMPELANQFAPARRDKTDVVTDQRIGDPSGLDFVRPKPTTPEQRPELPMTGVPGEQPEAIPDMTPTDQDIEGLFDGQGMPERFQDDPSKDAVSAAFLRERGRAFGDARGQIEGAPGLYEEPEGVDFIDTPEGQALLQNRMTPMSPEEQAPPGGIDPLTPTPRTPASPTPETPGMTPRVPPAGREQDDMLAQIAGLRPEDMGPLEDEEIGVPRLDHKGRVMAPSEYENAVLRVASNREDETGTWARPDDIPPRLWNLLTDEEKRMVSGRVYRSHSEYGIPQPFTGPDPFETTFGANTR